MMARSLRSRSLHDVSAARQPTASRACKQRRAAARQQSNVQRKALLRVIDPEFPYFDHRPRRTVGGLRAEKKKLLPEGPQARAFPAVTKSERPIYIYIDRWQAVKGDHEKETTT